MLKNFLNLFLSPIFICFSLLFIALVSIAPSVTASLVNNSSPLIAGTNQSIVCFVEPSIATLEFITWMRNGSPVNTSDSRVTVSMTTRNSTLTISSLRTSDGGQYQCMGTVVSNGTTINITDEIDLNVTSEYWHRHTSHKHAVIMINSFSFSCSLHQQCHSDHHT